MSSKIAMLTVSCLALAESCRKAGQNEGHGVFVGAAEKANAINRIPGMSLEGKRDRFLGWLRRESIKALNDSRSLEVQAAYIRIFDLYDEYKHWDEMVDEATNSGTEESGG